MIAVHSIVRWLASVAVVLLIACDATLAQTTPPPVDQGWPRVYSKDGTTVTMHQPQVDSWKDYDKLRFRAAIEVLLSGSHTTQYGVVAAEAATEVHRDAGTVVMSNLQVAVRFPSVSADEAAALSAVVKDVLPSRPAITIALSRIMAYLHDRPAPAGVPLNLEPPTIHYSATPAILVIFMGQPSFKPIKGTGLMFAVNTNWLILMDGAAGQYYLLDDGAWITTTDPLNGPWTPAQSLPASFSALPTDGSWDEVTKNMPGKPLAVAPTVFASTQPAELIVTQGMPSYSPIYGTSLMYITNPTMTVFLDMTDDNYYFLAAGRWFRSAALTGPWTAASANLPGEFMRIPHDSPMAYVLASVPGSQAAKDAVMLAQVPHKATVNKDQAKVTVAYQGDPKFVAIDNTSLQYAVNTGSEVVLASGTYYCCSSGVWFQSGSAMGPWTVCTSVPAAIYTIPPTCPIYNVTYVKVYDTTPTTVVYGYTSGYSGEYVATTGALMFGAGMLTGALLASNDNCYWGCPPCYYSYGCAPVYHTGYGTYYRGASCYGPYGGAGYAAGYNPATGTFARGAYKSGPYGSAGAVQAYNPWTGNYGAHAGGQSGYGSWGASTVSNGSQWASAAHETNANGVSRGWAENSSGQWAQAAHAGNSTVAQTSNGDMYAGHDGNVYKKSDDGQWSKYDNGSWNSVNKSSSGGVTMPSNTSNSWSNQFKSGSGSNWQSSWENGSASRESEGNSWASHDTQNSLNRDSYARSSGGGWGGWGGESRWGGGGGGRSWGGGGGGGFHRR